MYRWGPIQAVDFVAESWTGPARQLISSQARRPESGIRPKSDTVVSQIGQSPDYDPLTWDVFRYPQSKSAPSHCQHMDRLDFYGKTVPLDFRRAKDRELTWQPPLYQDGIDWSPGYIQSGFWHYVSEVKRKSPAMDDRIR